jgi:hypothetical protein
LQFAVHDWVQQNHDIALADVLQPRDTYVVVTRTNYRVIWQEVEPDEFALLQQVIAGAALRDAVTSAIRDSTGDIDLLASRLELMFSRWATLRLFVGIA